MADKTINQLTEDTTPTGDDFIPSWDSSTGQSKKVQIQNFKAYASAMFNPYKFNAYRNAAWNKGNGIEVINFDTEIYDTGSNFDSTTNYRFTAPIAGFYHFDANAFWASNADQTQFWLGLFKNGVQIKLGTNLYTSGATGCGPHTSGDIQLAAGDYVDVRGFWGGSAVGGTTGLSVTWFTGFIISAT